MTEFVNHHWFVAVDVYRIAVFLSKSNDREDSSLNVQLGNRLIFDVCREFETAFREDAERPRWLNRTDRQADFDWKQ